jgi:uncharacterized protein
MNEKFFQDLREKIQIYFEKGGSHAFDHTDRVYKIALKLSKGENVDLDVIKAAVLLHDIFRLREDRDEVECHAQDGAEEARKILQNTNFPKDKIEKIVSAIKTHRHSKGLKAENKEGEILQDADKLDALGAITIARMFSTGGKFDVPLCNPDIPIDDQDRKAKNQISTIHGFYGKILKIKPEIFHTEKARKIAKKRYAFVEKFLKQFKLEWEGKA